VHCESDLAEQVAAFVAKSLVVVNTDEFEPRFCLPIARAYPLESLARSGKVNGSGARTS
jgi:hypothetical protein